MKLFVVGDVVISDNNKISMSQALLDLVHEQDYRICNFEGAIIDCNSFEIDKAGPHVYNCENTVEFIKQIGINVAAIANNHILDFGKAGLNKTLKKFDSNTILHTGADNSFETAYKPLILNKNDEKVCFINACQAEFGVLKDGSEGCGYAWLGSSFLKKTIINAVKQYNSVILYLHAGLENEFFPMPELKSLYHEFADILQGKGIIIGNHPHIIQGYEVYNGIPIFYSLGNFCFPLKNNPNFEWNRSLIVIYDTISKEFIVRPVKFENSIIDFDDSEKTKNDIFERSELLKDNKKLNEMANETAERTWNEYYKDYYKIACNNNSIFDYSVLRLIKFLIKKIVFKVLNRKQKTENCINETFLLHNIQIEPHRWCVERYLYNMNRKSNKL